MRCTDHVRLSFSWLEGGPPASFDNQPVNYRAEKGGIWGRTTALRRPAAGTPDACIDFGEKTNHSLPSPRALPQSPGLYQCRRVARQADDRSLDASPRARRSFSNSRKFMVLPNTQRCRHGFRAGKSCSQGGDSIPPMPKCGRLLKSGVSGFFASLHLCITGKTDRSRSVVPRDSAARHSTPSSHRQRPTAKSVKGVGSPAHR
ncbi:uncharacterized protein CCOS01_06341 [Colletotrichum costaricense]|uniref:Uncharacterized protein n=1 Tax=Colletotrichum costaricense TaxID=1209916 RepID=A0AAJ0E1Q3_9PEZI|nr:uncharacterized protein CCOS01_06341 [Colletotrichum costaricense]KAK1528507.1 hypothetical protein CCOS01_06341 [Colletotrichum costaricense]